MGLPLLATLAPTLLATATLVPSTRTPTWLPTPTVPLFPLTNLPSLPPVPTTSPPRELPTLLLVPLLLPPLSLLLDPSLLDPSPLVESMPMLPQLLTAMVVPST